MNRQNGHVKRIGLITSGGDCSGMNACIRGVTLNATEVGIEVFGFQKGFHGILENEYITLNEKNVTPVIDRGGTFLQSARCRRFMTEEGKQLALENLTDLGIDALIVIGGNGSIRGAYQLHNAGFPVTGIPASIDNDIYGTDLSIGVDTALNVICRSVDMIRDTASSHDRIFVVEVMGRDSGYLTLAAAVTAGAEAVIIPERAFCMDQLSVKIRKHFMQKKSCAIILTAEGAAKAEDIATCLREELDHEVRISVLGHIQRGGSPSHQDRMLASMMARASLQCIKNNISGTMVALQGNRIVQVPLKEVIDGDISIPEDLVSISESIHPENLHQ